MIVYIIISIALVILTFLITRFIYLKRVNLEKDIINELMIIDEESGLYNRSFFNKTYLSEFYRARRIKHPLAILFIESVMSPELSNTLLTSIKRDTDFISIYSKNLFVAILYNTDSNGVDMVTNRLLEKISVEYKISIGVHVGIPDNHVSSQNMLDEALKALKKASNQPCNCVEFSVNSI